MGKYIVIKNIPNQLEYFKENQTLIFSILNTDLAK